MIISEVKELQELTVQFTQAILDNRVPQNWKFVLNAKGFDGVFTQLYNLSIKSKTTSDIRVIALFKFLGDKINTPNQEEYANAVQYDIELRLKKNGISNWKKESGEKDTPCN